MATTKIRGITVEIGGDTSGLQTSLRNVNKDLNSTQSQLRDVERLLKLDPSNVDLLRQKQQLLARAVEQTAEKLQTLEDAQAAFIANGGDVNSDAYRALEREIISTRSSLDKATKNASKFNATIAETSAKLQEVSDKAGAVAEKTEGLSKAAQGVLVAAAGAAALSIKEFASYEQNLGGIETFFKESADIVVEYAQNAYKTAGLSANEYMQTVTGFSAALLTSLGGNTRAAAELADIAITDMADNANKFGTNIESIQSAYQGFAKQNYNMLDNLKLGFAGNKAGMQALLEEAERLTGVKFDISNFSDIVIAIHEVQKSMGVAGTTAKEAEETIAGSIATLKAAVADLALGFATADADVQQLTDNTMTAFKQVLENILPVIQQIISSLPAWAQWGLGLTAVAAVISPLATAISAVSGAISSLSAALPVVIAFVEGFAATAGGAITIVTGLVIAIGKLGEAFKKFATKQFEMGNGDWMFQDPTYNSGMPWMASGGVLSSGSAIVGEAGPEVLTMSNGNAVVRPLTTNNYTTNNYNQSAGGYHPIDVTLLLDSATLARVMVQPNARAVSLAGESAVH